jgi:hypothetical protein
LRPIQPKIGISLGELAKIMITSLAEKEKHPALEELKKPFSMQLLFDLFHPPKLFLPQISILRDF